MSTAAMGPLGGLIVHRHRSRDHRGLVRLCGRFGLERLRLTRRFAAVPSRIWAFIVRRPVGAVPIAVRMMRRLPALNHITAGPRVNWPFPTGIGRRRRGCYPTTRAMVMNRWARNHAGLAGAINARPFNPVYRVAASQARSVRRLLPRMTRAVMLPIPMFAIAGPVNTITVPPWTPSDWPRRIARHGLRYRRMRWALRRTTVMAVTAPIIILPTIIIAPGAVIGVIIVPIIIGLPAGVAAPPPIPSVPAVECIIWPNR